MTTQLLDRHHQIVTAAQWYGYTHAAMMNDVDDESQEITHSVEI